MAYFQYGVRHGPQVSLSCFLPQGVHGRGTAIPWPPRDLLSHWRAHEAAPLIEQFWFFARTVKVENMTQVDLQECLAWLIGDPDVESSVDIPGSICDYLREHQLHWWNALLFVLWRKNLWHSRRDFDADGVALHTTHVAAWFLAACEQPPAKLLAAGEKLQWDTEPSDDFIDELSRKPGVFHKARWSYPGLPSWLPEPKPEPKPEPVPEYLRNFGDESD